MLLELGSAMVAGLVGADIGPFASAIGVSALLRRWRLIPAATHSAPNFCEIETGRQAATLYAAAVCTAQQL